SQAAIEAGALPNAIAPCLIQGLSPRCADSAKLALPGSKSRQRPVQESGPRYRTQTSFPARWGQHPHLRFGLTLRCRNVLEIPLPRSGPTRPRAPVSGSKLANIYRNCLAARPRSRIAGDDERKEDSHYPLRAVAYRLSAYRGGPYRIVQLALCTASPGQIPAADRGYRPAAFDRAGGRRHFRGPALARPRLGWRGRASVFAAGPACGSRQRPAGAGQGLSLLRESRGTGRDAREGPRRGASGPL